jgi:hypothetical protein
VGQSLQSPDYSPPVAVLVGRHENLPPGVSVSDNELGWSMSVGKLAALVEGRCTSRPASR